MLGWPAEATMAAIFEQRLRQEERVSACHSECMHMQEGKKVA